MSNLICIFVKLKAKGDTMDYTKFDKYIGEQLLAARQNKRLTLANMSDLITAKLIINGDKKQRVSLQAYQNYEQGSRSIPMTILEYACDILKLDTVTVMKNANKKFMEGIERKAK